ncbi:MAG: hypothetical protein U5K31_05830 [Balneolaceae bacterium]|nr:hypothetical protein [Balneolaceae bacterium]
MQNQDAEILQQSREQARNYIANIRQERNLEQNLWALAALADASGEINSYIGSYLSSDSIKNPLLASFRDTSLSYGERLRDTAIQQKSPALLLAYFLAESDSLQKETVYSEFPFQSISGNTNYRRLARSLLRRYPDHPRNPVSE